MGFYFRKSIKVGALRFNFSKSGIGLSTGIKGFRIGTGPKGNYIHAGTNGFYYRKTFGNTNRIEDKHRNTNENLNQQPVDSVEYNFNDIESGNVQFMTDSSFDEIIQEINDKATKIPIFLVFLILNVLALFWNQNAIWIFAITIPLGIVIDKRRKTTYLVYDIEKEKEEKLQKFYDTFSEIINADKKWHISSEAGLSGDYEKKINSGASSIVKRQSTTMSYGLPKLIVANLEVPVIGVGKQKLFFLPERILIQDGKQFGTINYNDLKIKAGNTQFIESESVPNDSEIVGKTWKYVNKKGGPDKRFKDNREYPIMIYTQLHFTSESGLNELVMISKPNIGSELIEALRVQSKEKSTT